MFQDITFAEALAGITIGAFIGLLLYDMGRKDASNEDDMPEHIISSKGRVIFIRSTRNETAPAPFVEIAEKPSN